MRPTLGLIAALTLTLAPTALAQVGQLPRTSPAEARTAFLEANAGTGFFINDHGNLTRVYGRAFSHGNSPVESAAAFVAQHASIWGADASQLLPIGPWGEGAHMIPLMWDAFTDTYNFSLVGYTQAVHGVPVFRSSLRLLVRNEAGFPLVLVSSDLKDLGTFPETVKAFIALGAPLDPSRYASKLQKRLAAAANDVPAELVIFAGEDDLKVAPRLGVKFIVDRGMPGDSDYARLLYITDPATGEVMFEENQVCYADATGTVQGQATPGFQADACAVEATAPLQYARVSIGATSVFADVNGNFVIPGQTGSVTITSTLAGKYFKVLNAANANSTPTASATGAVGTPLNPMFNEGNLVEAARAEVNAYRHANIVRDFALANNPSYPTIANQLNFTINVQVSGTCNAFYNGNSINFYPAGGGCNNTAFSTVVHHEFGHHMVASGGSGQGAYGEGMSDCMSLLISDDPRLGLGFQSCNTGIRNADNTCTYLSTGCSSCGSAIHSCGQLISGCVWDTREALGAKYGSAAGLARTSLICVNSIPLHTGTTIAGDITIDFLTLDDNNSDIADGTPNYNEINGAFTLHGLPGPALLLLSFSFPNGIPATVSPAGSTTLAMNVAPLAGTPQLGSGTFFWRNGGTGSFAAAPMTQGAPNQYTIQVPATACLSSVQWYVSASTTTGSTVTSPSTAPAAFYTSLSAATVQQVFADSMDTDTGWSTSASTDTATTGKWERVDPIPTPAQPDDDAGAGTQCYITANGTPGGALGEQDVDGGTTTLTCPMFNLAGFADGVVSYARWYSNNTGSAPNADSMPIEISNDGGSTWVQMELVTENLNAWATKSFRIGQFVTPTATMKVRFRARDEGAGSVVEAGVDDFRVDGISCTVSNPADIDGNGNVDGADLGLLLAGWGSSSPDVNGDGVVDGSDLGLLLAAWVG
ncbi:MAG: hypothetical protein FJ252_02370 [Phycisphaerae bacterium]|nr:hypothetical protein [Phycisphaerae bacterium]